MSAIWGLIQFNQNIDDKKVSDLSSMYNQYNLDRTDYISKDNIFLGCGHQYFTNEACIDISPIYDKENNIYFLSDCFLTNRDDVFKMLEMTEDSKNPIGDSELCFQLYKKHGNEFVKHLRGAFAFVIYDIAQNILTLFADHFSKRYLAYSLCDDFICFGSTYAPIKYCYNNNMTINEHFITLAYKNMSPMNFVEPSITTYENVFHINNATYITFDLNKKEKTTTIYWNPLENIKKLKLNSEEEYKKVFLSTYQKATESLLRARNNTGIMLSGGLDSASVCAFAAPFLKKQNKNLFSYTAVPATGYDSEIDSWLVEDETYLIKEQQKFHSNLISRFIAGNDNNCIDKMDAAQKNCGMPVKPMVNNINIENMSIAAQKDNCSILLSGSNGNATVSYGNIGCYLSLTLTKGHPIRCIKELSKYCVLYKKSRKKFLLEWLKEFIDYYIHKPEENFFFLREELVKKYHIEHTSYDEQKKFGTDYHVTEKQKNNFIYIPTQYIQKGFYYTLNSLEFGYIQLDPTLTVEMVELCLSLPDECFCHNGLDRYMIRGFMKELIPYAVIDIHKGFGLQAADTAFKANRDWDRNKDDVYDILNEPLLRNYLDNNEIEELIERIKQTEYHLANNDVWFISEIGSLGYFLRENS